MCSQHSEAGLRANLMQCKADEEESCVDHSITQQCTLLNGCNASLSEGQVYCTVVHLHNVQHFSSPTKQHYLLVKRASSDIRRPAQCARPPAYRQPVKMAAVPDY